MQIPGLNLLNVITTSESAQGGCYGDAESHPDTNIVASASSQCDLDSEPNHEQRLSSFQMPEQHADVARPSVEQVVDALDRSLAESSPSSSPMLDCSTEDMDDAQSYHSDYVCRTYKASGSSDNDNDSVSDIINAAQLRSLRDLEDDGDDNEEGDAIQESAMRTKNELPADLGPVNLSDTSIDNTTPIDRLGTIEKVMGSIIIVRAETGGEYKILGEGAIVVTDTRELISETFGRVQQPRYVIRLVESMSLCSDDLVDRPVFYVADRAQFVFTRALRGLKGSDASNVFDEEIDDEEREFSDDEKEMEFKRSLKRKKGNDPAKRKHPPIRGENSPSAFRSPRGEQNRHILTYKPYARPTPIDLPSTSPLLRTVQSHSIDRTQLNPQQLPINKADQPAQGRGSTYFQTHLQSSSEQPVSYPFLSNPSSPGAAALPPGAYVNPAFFVGPFHEGPHPPPSTLHPDIKQQIDILRSLPPHAQ